MRLDLSQVRDYDADTVESEAAESAAVLVPVIECEYGDAILFTMRSQQLSTHAGEMSFPGGGYEVDDADLEATALRESHEEVAIPSEEVEVVGRHDDVPGPYGHVVRPYVGRIPDREYGPASTEVASVAVIDVADLADPANHSTEERSHPDRGTAVLPFFRVGDHTVWGLTGFILESLLDLATERDGGRDEN